MDTGSLKFVPGWYSNNHIAELPISVLFDTNHTGRFEVNGKVYSVDMNNPRYELFRQSLACKCCQIRGNRFFLDEIYDRPGIYHLNLYAEFNNHLILLIKDHVIPKKDGGGEGLDNSQTMCWTCNSVRTALDIDAATLQKAARLIRHVERQVKATDKIQDELSYIADQLKKEDGVVFNVSKNLDNIKDEGKRAEAEAKMEMARNNVDYLINKYNSEWMAYQCSIKTTAD